MKIASLILLALVCMSARAQVTLTYTGNEVEDFVLNNTTALVFQGPQFAASIAVTDASGSIAYAVNSQLNGYETFDYQGTALSDTTTNGVTQVTLSGPFAAQLVINSYDLTLMSAYNVAFDGASGISSTTTPTAFQNACVLESHDMDPCDMLRNQQQQQLINSAPEMSAIGALPALTMLAFALALMRGRHR